MDDLRTLGDDESVLEDGATFERNLVLVAGASDGAGGAYAAIAWACTTLHLRAERLPDSESLSIKQITDLIRRAEFLVFDLTGGRPSVYYSLGYAHGVGNEALDVLVVAAEGTRLDFALAPLPVQYYGSPEQLRDIVGSRLHEMMQQTRR